MGRYNQQIKLLDAEGTETHGPVRACGEYEAPTVVVSDLSGGDSVQLKASNKRFNEAVAVADLENAGAPITADGTYSVDPGAQWIAAQKIGTASTPTVRLAGSVLV